MSKTLGQLAIDYKAAPKMLAAIRLAIDLYTRDTKATIVSGQPSLHKNSNIYKQCGDTVLDIIPGANLRYKSEGYKNIVILKY